MLRYISLALVALAVALAAAEDVSPCPELFQYISSKEGSFEGTLKLKSDAKLHGLWIRLFFDGPVDKVKVPEGYEAVNGGNDNAILIKNRDVVLSKKAPIMLPITVSYKGTQKPKLTQFRVNARDMCPEDNE